MLRRVCGLSRVVRPVQALLYHRVSLSASFPFMEDLQKISERLKRLPFHDHKPVSNREAAVLIPLFQDEAGDVRVILTQRSSTLRTHQGEVALPGGKSDPEDGTCIATALREAHEEMGLEPTCVDVIAKLPPVLSKHCLSVTPVIGVLTHHVSDALRPNPGEVDCIFDMPLRFFLEDNERHTYHDVTMGKFPYRIHHFEYEAFEVWGLTAGILIRVAELAFGRKAAFDTLGTGVDYASLWFDGKSILGQPSR